MIYMPLNGSTAPGLILLLIFNISLIFALRFVAPRINLIDHPGGRKTHPHPTPLIGGVAIYLTLLAAVAINNDWSSDIGMIILWAGIIVLFGFIDDINNVRWPLRLFVQVVAALGVVLTTGIKVTYLGTYPIIGPVALDHLSTAFTVFAVVGLTNAFNLIDGIDGLCGSLLFLPASVLMGISYSISGEIDYYNFTLLALLSVFLTFNLRQNTKHKLFMGDAGSAGLGFIISFIVITNVNYQKLDLTPPFALWLLLVPISDTINVIARRVLEGKSIFKPGLDHFHHRLMAIGFTQSKALSVILIVALVGVIGGIFLNSFNDVITICVFLTILVFISQILMILENYTAKKHL